MWPDKLGSGAEFKEVPAIMFVWFCLSVEQSPTVRLRALLLQLLLNPAADSILFRSL